MDISEELASERRARLAAERLLELRQRELHEANAMLGKHAIALTEEIVDKREEAEEAREEAAAAVSQVDIAKRRLWNSIEAVNDGFAVFDSDSRMVIANSGYLSVFDGLHDVSPGISYEEMLWLMAEEGIVNMGNLHARKWVASMMERWEQPQPEPRTIRLWDKSHIKLLDRRAPTGDTTCLALNVTEAIHNERRLKDATSRAQAASRAKSAFLAKMSHELRTPMNGVVGMAELLQATQLDDEQSLFVETIMSSGEALLVLINDVLDFSKLEAQRMELKNVEFDLEQLLIEVVRLVEPTVQDDKVELVLDYDMFLPTKFYGDAGRIRQVFMNLIGNAVKFTEKGEVVIRALGVPNEAGGSMCLKLSVEDSGIGIPEGKVHHIFGEFNQVEDESNRKFEGTGLGLAITDQLVRLLKGEIWVESAPGKGSVFGVNLELEAREELDHLPDLLPRWMKSVTLHDTGSAVLGVLGAQLKGLGAEITSVAGDQVLDVIADETADVLLVDLRQLDIDAFAEQLRARQEDHAGPLVAAIRGAPNALPSDLEDVVLLRRPVLRKDLLQALDQHHQAKQQRPKAEEKPEPTEDNVTVAQSETGLDPAEDVAADDARGTTETDAPMRRMRVLAAEDNKTNRLVFEKLVKSLNIDLDFAENGQEAVKAWRECKPDLIFMDISMPIMDGKEATRIIRRQERKKGRPHTPIVAVTAHALDGDDKDVLAAGLDHYLTKPLKRRLIFEQIRTHAPDDVQPAFPNEVQENDESATGEDADTQRGQIKRLADAVGFKGHGAVHDGRPSRAEPENVRGVWNNLAKQADLAATPHALPAGTGVK